MSKEHCDWCGKDRRLRCDEEGHAQKAAERRREMDAAFESMASDALRASRLRVGHKR